MEIKRTYIGILDGKRGFFCGFKPANLILEEEREVLCPSENKLLVRKSNEEIFSAVWLKNGDQPENYEEIDAKSKENKIA